MSPCLGGKGAVIRIGSKESNQIPPMIVDSNNEILRGKDENKTTFKVFVILIEINVKLDILQSIIATSIYIYLRFK